MGKILKKGVLALGSCVVLAACGGNSGAIPRASVEPVNAAGYVDVDLEQSRRDRVSRSGVGTVAMGVGFGDGKTIRAVAGIVNGARVGAAVNGGRATYDARYQYVGADNIWEDDTHYGGTFYTSPERNITLNADFGAGTLRGTSSDLTVHGKISGTDLGGTITVDPSGIYPGSGLNTTVTTSLDGKIGRTGVIGTFTGTAPNATIAGGIVGRAR